MLMEKMDCQSTVDCCTGNVFITQPPITNQDAGCCIFSLNRDLWSMVRCLTTTWPAGPIMTCCVLLIFQFFGFAFFLLFLSPLLRGPRDHASRLVTTGNRRTTFSTLISSTPTAQSLKRLGRSIFTRLASTSICNKTLPPQCYGS